MQTRCDLCGLFGCQHVREAKSNVTNIGDSLDNVLSNLQEASEEVMPRDQDGVPVHAEAKTEPKIRIATTPKRQIIPPPPRIGVTGPIASKQDDKISIINNDGTGFVVCNLCKANVAMGYLNIHMKAHTSEYEKKKSTSITIVPKQTPIVGPVITTKPKQSIKSIEQYRFKKIETACIGATVSNNRRYSDFTCVLWLEHKQSTWSGSYAGSQSTYSKDQERLSIHIIYDSLEDYFTINCRLFERSSFSTFDREVGSIPDRVCYQEDILSEIKKMLLFLQISPKAAYKHFRKCCKLDMQVETNKLGAIYIAQSSNANELSERLKKPADNKGWSGNQYPYHGH